MTTSNLGGQMMGAKGRETRRRLLTVTRDMLATTSLRDLRAADIARRARASKATFYLYFENVEAVALALAEETAAVGSGLITLAEADWSDGPAIHASEFVRSYFEFWDVHRPVLRVQNLAAEEGDHAFHQVRLRLSAPLHMALAAKIEAAQAAGRQDRAQHGLTLAAVVLASMERNAAGYLSYPRKYGVTRERLIKSSASVLLAVIGADTPGALQSRLLGARILQPEDQP